MLMKTNMKTMILLQKKMHNCEILCYKSEQEFDIILQGSDPTERLPATHMTLLREVVASGNVVEDPHGAH